MALVSLANTPPISRAMLASPRCDLKGSSKGCQNRVPDYVDVVIEVPKGSCLKRRPDGSVDFVVPFPCPFNYGSIHSFRAPDGDPLDAIVLGEYLPYGHKGTWNVKGMLKFMDAGFVDNKLVCIQPVHTCRPCFKLNPESEPFEAIEGSKVGATPYFQAMRNNDSNEDISILDWFSLSCVFNAYAIFKGAVNSARGKHGSTSFDGWEFYC